MQFDFSRIPTTLDGLHIGLMTIILILLILLVALLTVSVIGLVRKPRIDATAPIADKLANEPALSQEKRTEPAARIQSAPEPGILKDTKPDAALQLIGLLQQEARFIDFIEEEVTSYSDTEIGAAARVVHAGCHKILHEHFDFAPIFSDAENSRVTLPKGFDSSTVRLTGNIVGQAPFKGTLLHRGWRASKVKLPKIADGHDINILASAEVEL